MEKRPLISSFSNMKHEKKDEDQIVEEEPPFFPIYSARSQQDMSVMVSALSRVLGCTGSENLQVSSDSTNQNSSTTAGARILNQPRSNQEQGKHMWKRIYIYVC